MINEDNQINTFKHQSEIFTGEQIQPNLKKRVLKQIEKKMDSQLKVIQADQNIVVPLVEALDKDFQSEIYFDLSEAKAQNDSKKDSVEKNSQVAKIVQAPES